MAHPLSRFRVNNKESKVYDDRQAAVEIVARNAQVCETEPAAKRRRDSRVFMVNVCKISTSPAQPNNLRATTDGPVQTPPRSPSASSFDAGKIPSKALIALLSAGEN
jgi:hypothetical protein